MNRSQNTCHQQPLRIGEKYTENTKEKLKHYASIHEKELYNELLKREALDTWEHTTWGMPMETARIYNALADRQREYAMKAAIAARERDDEEMDYLTCTIS